MAKKKAAAVRKPNFPLVFWDGMRERAQSVADELHGGNLSAMVNTAVSEYVRKAEAKSKK